LGNFSVFCGDPLKRETKLPGHHRIPEEEGVKTSEKDGIGTAVTSWMRFSDLGHPNLEGRRGEKIVACR